MKKTLIRILAASLLLCMLCTILPQIGFAQETQTVTFEEISEPEGSPLSVSEDAETTQSTEETHAADDEVRVTITLKQNSALKQGYSTKAFSDNQEAVTYSRQLLKTQEELAKKISDKALNGKTLKVEWNLTVVANAISATVPYGKIEAIEALSDVESVELEPCFEVPEDQSGSEDTSGKEGTAFEMTGTAQAWAAGYTGAGSRIAVIDTGTNAQHISFSEEGWEYSLEQNAELSGISMDDYMTSLNLLDAEEIAAVLPELHAKKKLSTLTAEQLVLSMKLPFAFNYVDRNLNTSHDTDSQGIHGSHVAGIATANRYILRNGEYVDSASTVYTAGQAPDAQLITMKVFGAKGGAYASDYMAAVEDAIRLNCDAVNLSLASDAPGNSSTGNTSFENIMLTLMNSDTVMSVSAGNSYAWSDYSAVGGYNYIGSTSMDTVANPGSLTAAFTAASVDSSSVVTSAYLGLGTGMVYYREILSGQSPIVSLDPENTETDIPYIVLTGTGEESEYTNHDVTGKIVIVNRDGSDFYQKQLTAQNHGAAALVIANNVVGALNIDLKGSEATIPCISITKADRARFVRESQANADGTYSGTVTVHGKPELNELQKYGYVMSDFSAWGVPGDLTLKPDITAPGGSVYSVDGTADSPTEYKRMSGTSMSAPQIAGMSAVLAQYIRDNDLCTKTGLSQRQLIHAILMSTATPVVDEQNSSEYSVLKQGAGLANIADAVSTAGYLTVPGQTDGKAKVELGDDPARTGKYAFSFSVNNFMDEPVSYLLDSSVLTQAAFSYYLNKDAEEAQDASRTAYYMDKVTTELLTSVSYTVNGVGIEQNTSIAYCDFDGDGDVDQDDGQTLMDYVIGLRETISAEALADLDKNGSVDTFDVQQFLANLEQHTVTVPAGGSTEVQVSIILTEEQKATLDEIYTGGAYVEGFIYLNAQPNAEGSVSSNLSLPVLAYYGSWTDSNMFEAYGYEEYSCESKVELQQPYIKEAGNYLRIYSAKYGYKMLSGNPYFTAKDFIADRLSFSNTAVTGTWLSDINVTPIRNAAATRFTLTNAETDEVYKEIKSGAVTAAYARRSVNNWVVPGTRRNINWMGTTADGKTLLAEGTVITATMQAAPAYNTASDGTVDWNSLGDGSKYSVQLTIDNTAPKALSISTELLNGETLYVTAQDNRYIAAVALLDSTGGQVLQQLDPNQTQIGASCTLQLDISSFDSEEFIVALCDYAMNERYYKVNVPRGQKTANTDTFHGFTAEGNYWVSFNAEVQADEHKLTAGKADYRMAAYAEGVAFAATDNTLYVFDGKDSYATPIYAGTGELQSLRSMTFDSNEKVLYACCSTGSVKGLYSIDKDTGETGRMSDFILGTKAITMISISYAQDGLFYGLSDDMRLYSFRVTGAGATELKLLGSTAQAKDNGCSLAWNGTALYLANGTELFELATTNGASTQVGTLSEPMTAIFCPNFETDQSMSDKWYTPLNYLDHAKLSENELTLLAGENATLQMNYAPWNLTDTTVLWSSDKPEVATVKNGVVTGVSDGTAVITAVMALNSNMSASCTVTVIPSDTQLLGVGTDAAGNSSISRLSSSGWQHTALTDEANVISAVKDEFNTYWLQSADGTMLQVDIATGETVRTVVANEHTNLNADMCICSEYGGIYSISGAKLIMPWNMRNNDGANAKSFDFLYSLAYADATCFVGIVSTGYYEFSYEDEEDVYDSERLLLLDNAGNLWTAYVMLMDGEYECSMDTYSKVSGLNSSCFAERDGLLRNSLVYEEKTQTLTLTAYNGSSTDTFLLHEENEAWTASEIGKTDGSMALFTGSLQYSAAAAAEQLEPMTGLAEHAATLAQQTELVNTVTVTIPATENTTNKRMSIEYDATELTLLGVYSDMTLTAYSDKVGSIDFGCADIEETKAGNTLATFVFSFEGDYINGSMEVETTERNDSTVTGKTSTYSYSEEEGGHNYQLTDSREATCLNEGYVTYTCTKCGGSYTETTPATGHSYGEWLQTTAPTCTAAGTSTSTCSLCGETVTKTVEALGHDYLAEEDGATYTCTLCGDSYCLPAPIITESFDDVAEGDWYYDAVNFVLNKGLMAGVSEQSFGVKGTTTRAMAAAILYRLAGSPTVTVSSRFTDVPAGQWYSEAVAYAAQEGLLAGYGNGTFGPDDSITREQLAVILYNYAKKEGKDTGKTASLLTFTDGGDTSTWAQTAVQWAVAQGLLTGKSGSILDPKGTAARTELAAILTRYLSE